ncbi:MAG TPA: hypothetical protein VK849_01705 [Longimicrobiales bacterium]|nr:hypothetical protein [Longimicrobiales bacterium]
MSDQREFLSEEEAARRWSRAAQLLLGSREDAVTARRVVRADVQHVLGRWRRSSLLTPTLEGLLSHAHGGWGLPPPPSRAPKEES